MENIVLASNNDHKIKEFQEMLDNYTVLSLRDIGFLEDIVEDGNTFLENSLIKAKTVSQYLKEKGLSYDVMADDSGLCVSALNGEPGIYSARYAGNHNDQENRNKLRKKLEGIDDRSASFVCQLVLYHPDGTYQDFLGKTDGVILMEEKGSKEFGYDCIFYSNELQKTFGEASPGEKNSVSHRGRAIQKLKEELKK